MWSLRVDVHILDHNGNLADAASLSALAALLAFRRPEVTLEAGGGGVGVGEGQRVVVHPPDVREPLPLSIHHIPLAVTFASFQVSISHATLAGFKPCCLPCQQHLGTVLALPCNTASIVQLNNSASPGQQYSPAARGAST